MTLSMVMIARNERHNIGPCFESFWDHVDEVVLCDTGSRDGTVAEARSFAKERGEPGKLIVGRFKWCDDFAAARNHAHSLASGEWHCYLDLDDRISGAERLRAIAAEAAPDVAAFSFPYLYQVVRMSNQGWQAPDGLKDLGMLMRRMFRPEAGRWVWPIHETWQVHEGARDKTMQSVRWHHQRDRDNPGEWVAARERNNRILDHWSESEPDHPEMLRVMSGRLMYEGQGAAAEPLLRQFLRTPTRVLRAVYTNDTDDQWSATALQLAVILEDRGNPRAAHRLATRACARSPRNPWPRLLLAQYAAAAADYERVIEHAVQAWATPSTLTAQ